jgi:hypothetical protein
VILYYFTGSYTLRTLGAINEDGLYQLKCGLKPHTDSWREWRLIFPSPPTKNVVWLTSDPQARLFQDRDINSTKSRIRFSVAISSNDRRLAHFCTHTKKHTGIDMLSALPPEAREVLRRFWVYFGEIPIARIRAVDDVRVAEAEAENRLAA